MLLRDYLQQKIDRLWQPRERDGEDERLAFVAGKSTVELLSEGIERRRQTRFAQRNRRGLARIRPEGLDGVLALGCRDAHAAVVRALRLFKAHLCVLPVPALWQSNCDQRDQSLPAFPRQ